MTRMSCAARSLPGGIPQVRQRRVKPTVQLVNPCNCQNQDQHVGLHFDNCSRQRIAEPPCLQALDLSAAQPQPNARGVTTALVAGIPLCRAALKGRLRRLGGRCKRNQRTNSSKAKGSNHALICDFSADYPILHSKGRTVVTALPTAREADTDKLSKLAV